MSIATAIQAAQQKIANAYAAISNKGGTLPATQNLSNMSAAINSIQTGITPTGTLPIVANGITDVTNYAKVNVNISSPTGTINITQNGTVDVTNYATANVSVAGIAPTGTKNITANGTYDVSAYEYAYVNISGGGGGTKYFGCGGETFIGEIDANGVLQASYNSQYLDTIIFTGVTNIGQAGLSAKFNNEVSSSASYTRARSRLVKDIAFPDLTEITGSYALYSFCNNQTMLQSVTFPELTTINAASAMTYAFSGCTSLTSVSFPKLKTVSGSNALSSAFRTCTSLANLYFGSLTGNISSNNTLTGVTGCTVHLPTGYAGTCNLGGTSTVYLYDL